MRKVSSFKTLLGMAEMLSQTPAAAFLTIIIIICNRQSQHHDSVTSKHIIIRKPAIVPQVAMVPLPLA